MSAPAFCLYACTPDVSSHILCPSPHPLILPPKLDLAVSCSCSGLGHVWGYYQYFLGAYIFGLPDCCSSSLHYGMLRAAGKGLVLLSNKERREKREERPAWQKEEMALERFNATPSQPSQLPPTRPDVVGKDRTAPWTKLPVAGCRKKQQRCCNCMSRVLPATRSTRPLLLTSPDVHPQPQVP